MVEATRRHDSAWLVFIKQPDDGLEFIRTNRIIDVF
jgi:hypothetical protein